MEHVRFVYLDACEYFDQLSNDKQRFIEKYSLRLNENHIWCRELNGSYPRRICSHEFMLTHDIITIVFRYYELCIRKTLYFTKYRMNFQPCIHYPFDVFVNCEWWATEFLYHKKTKTYIDLRFLQTLNSVQKFEDFLERLNS